MENKPTKYYLRARSDNKIYNFDCGNLEINADDLVIFENETCQEIATIIVEEELKEANASDKNLDHVVLIRRVGERDLIIDEERKAG